ncbi:MAG: methyltransferase domain-containing protein [Gammaproteobacteria bacterium]|nr:methyltransferase domain-containing protein [Gammaproteobacteria bacterium]
MTKRTDKAKFKQAEFDRKDHWEHIYSDKKSTEVSWYQQNPEYSLELIEATGVDKLARIIDIGGGASTLVDFLLAAGYQNLSVLDIARSAIEQAMARLDQQADMVEWIEHDITSFKAAEPFDVWHDRAVFHFLTDADDRLSYVKTMFDALKPGAHAIVATFNLDGPEKCSGLDIVRYSPETLSAIFGVRFQLVETRTEKHKTPSGTSQSFVYCRFLRV